MTESRVCQIHTKAVLQLRTRLSDRRTDGASGPGARPGRAKALGGEEQRHTLRSGGDQALRTCKVS